MNSQPQPVPVPQSASSAGEAVFLVLAGPAGSGKSTLCDRLVRDVPAFSRVVTTTTRPPRPGEVHGVHYHFLTPQEFDTKVAAGEFLEWAWVHKKHRYGTLASSVFEPLDAGRSLVINVDVQGVENFRRAGREHPLIGRHMATVFIRVPIPELRRRMVHRAQDNEEEIARRLATAEEELREAHRFDHLIDSTTCEADYDRLVAIWRAVQQRITQPPPA